MAEHRDRRTVKEAARCLKVSVSRPTEATPAASNNFRRRVIEVNVLPDPLAPDTMIA